MRPESSSSSTRSSQLLSQCRPRRVRREEPHARVGVHNVCPHHILLSLRHPLPLVQNVVLEHQYRTRPGLDIQVPALPTERRQAPFELLVEVHVNRHRRCLAGPLGVVRTTANEHSIVVGVEELPLPVPEQTESLVQPHGTVVAVVLLLAGCSPVVPRPDPRRVDELPLVRRPRQGVRDALEPVVRESRVVGDVPRAVPVYAVGTPVVDGRVLEAVLLGPVDELRALLGREDIV
mmetsp:Transcript_51624/g.109771  ORF Transcript_51624/g.109771 Transcript_51624/m.109771 type:complete len:234 (-) Transcript_51624:1190-1891(-)